MSDLFWLSDHQFAQMRPYFPLAHGTPRVDDRRVISGIIFVIKNGLRLSTGLRLSAGQLLARCTLPNMGHTRRCITASFGGAD